MGSGRVGASLAEQLDKMGHSVAVIDIDSDAFRRLPSDFTGRRVTGVGFDRESLRQAGIEDAYAFAAVSNGDNSNIIAARVVRESFGIERVAARIYDPERARVYQRLGIPTVGTVQYTTSQMLHYMIPDHLEVVHADSASSVSLVQAVVSEVWTGRLVEQFEDNYSSRVAYILRQGEALLPDRDTLFHEGDTAFFAVEEQNRIAALRALQFAPEKEVES
nr:TrkA family potassium uptake protein [Boudabousia marimammalium]